LANQECLKARKAGQDVVIIFPTALIGPYDTGHNHVVQMMKDFLNHQLPGVIKGGYDIADVRDLAKGIFLALFKENCSSSYILSGQQISLKDILLKTAEAYHTKRHVIVFRAWLAHIGVPFVKIYFSIRKKRPLYTSFALSVLKHANTFNGIRAREELGYCPRPLEDTITDTVNYLDQSGVLKKKK